MKNRLKSKFRKNNSGMIIADFLFAFVMVIGVGMFMFALTFSLATIEVTQYIVWSTARHYSAAQKNEIAARESAEKKFEALLTKFPLLVNSGWFEISRDDLKIGELDVIDPSFNINSDDKINNFRQPWTGASTTINLKLFSGLQIPFLGKVSTDPEAFKFPVRAFIIRNVSVDECKKFFKSEQRYEEGMKKLEDSKLAKEAFGPIQGTCDSGFCGEDNGC